MGTDDDLRRLAHRGLVVEAERRCGEMDWSAMIEAVKGSEIGTWASGFESLPWREIGFWFAVVSAALATVRSVTRKAGWRPMVVLGLVRRGARRFGYLHLATMLGFVIDLLLLASTISPALALWLGTRDRRLGRGRYELYDPLADDTVEIDLPDEDVDAIVDEPEFRMSNVDTVFDEVLNDVTPGEVASTGDNLHQELVLKQGECIRLERDVEEKQALLSSLLESHRDLEKRADQMRRDRDASLDLLRQAQEEAEKRSQAAHKNLSDLRARLSEALEFVEVRGAPMRREAVGQLLADLEREKERLLRVVDQMAHNAANVSGHEALVRAERGAARLADLVREGLVEDTMPADWDDRAYAVLRSLGFTDAGDAS